MLVELFWVTTPEEVTSVGSCEVACATRFCTLTEAISGSVPTSKVTGSE